MEKIALSFDELIGQPKVKVPNPDWIYACDSTRLGYYFFESRSPKRNLILIHGSGAHSLAGYQYLATSLSSEHDTNVFLFDLRGHGISEGNRGFASSSTIVESDFESMVDFVLNQRPYPLFVGGHSWGASLVLSAITRAGHDCKYAGLILISPSLGVGSGFNKFSAWNHPYAKLRFCVLVLGEIFGEKSVKRFRAIDLRFPKEVLDYDAKIVTSYNYPMLKAMLIKTPDLLFQRLSVPCCLTVGSEDELFWVERMGGCIEKMPESSRQKSIFSIVDGAKHLSIVLNIEKILVDFMDNLS